MTTKTAVLVLLAVGMVSAGVHLTYRDDAIPSDQEVLDARLSLLSSAKATIARGKKPGVAATFSPNGKEYGVWVWTPLSDLSDASMKSIVNSASANRFTAIYVTMDEYLVVDALPEGATKQALLAALRERAGTFVALATDKGIAVDAVAGAPDWGMPAHRPKALSMLSFVAEHNAGVANGRRFRGVQLDVEPYLLPEYAGGKESVLTAYVELVRDLAARSKERGLPLTMVIPHFFDAAQQWTPAIEVDGIKASTYEHLVRLLGPANGRVIIMAYRNFSDGENGAIALSQAEIAVANGSRMKVLIAQETGDAQPAYVTFLGTSRVALFDQLNRITTAFQTDASFAGTAVHYLDPYLQLK